MYISKLSQFCYLVLLVCLDSFQQSFVSGIGKTTLANLVAKTIGYEVLEFNASDVRSKSAIIEQVQLFNSTDNYS